VKLPVQSAGLPSGTAPEPVVFVSPSAKQRLEDGASRRRRVKTAVLKKDGITLIRTVEVADTLRLRLVGLLGRDTLGVGCAMHLSPCNCIHTFLMRFPIDLIFLSKSLQVTKLVWDVPANRIVSGGLNAWSVLELGSGWFPRDALHIGETVELPAQMAGLLSGTAP
jgi:uncharacterized protein